MLSSRSASLATSSCHERERRQRAVSGLAASCRPPCAAPFISRQREKRSRRQGRLDISCSAKPCTLYDLHTVKVPYVAAWDWQKAILQSRLDADLAGAKSADSLIVLQHPPVYTLGTASTEANLLFDPKNPPFELYRTERGGEATYHGPGQLVLYPILNLRGYEPDLHWYMRALEEVVIGALSEFELQGERVDGLTGVWVDGVKVAAQGVRARRWVTYHGVAINVHTDLSHFDSIIPCGIMDKSAGSIKQLLSMRGAPVPSDTALLEQAHGALLRSFTRVFGVELAPAAEGDAMLMRLRSACPPGVFTAAAGATR